MFFAGFPLRKGLPELATNCLLNFIQPLQPLGFSRLPQPDLLITNDVLYRLK